MDVPERQNVYQALRLAALLAGIALLGVAPHVYYLTSVAFAERMRERFGSVGVEQVLRAELASIGLVVLIAALVGAVFSKRYGLPGLGDLERLKRARLLVLVLAPVLSVVTYLLFGRAIAERVPGYYPDSAAWAAARALKGALFDEVVARFGMMTIFCGIVRRVWLANGLQALFFTALALLGLSFYGVEPAANVYFIASVLSSIGIHLVLGWIYARFGLAAAMLFHLVYGLKFLLHAFIA